jgi:glutathione S-transferase
MIVVHHLENSRSQRILWLLEELGVPYEVKRYERDKKTNLAPKELLKVHPTGKSPVIEDAGAAIAETGAIVEHIIDAHGAGRLAPARDTPEWRRYRYWMHAAEGSYMPPLVLTLMLGRMETAPMPFFAKPIAKRLTGAVRDGYLDHTIAGLFAYLDAELQKSAFLAGNDLTGADIMMSFPAEAMLQRGPAALKTGRLKTYVEKLQSRPAYKRALDRGGPYSLLS